MSTAWADRDTYEDQRLTQPQPSPSARRFAEVIAFQANRQSPLTTLYADTLTYWRQRERAEGMTIHEITYRDELAAAYILGRTDAHLLRDEALEAERDRADYNAHACRVFLVGMAILGLVVIVLGLR